MKRSPISEILMRLGAWVLLAAIALLVIGLAAPGWGWEQKAYLSLTLLVMVLSLWPPVAAIIRGPKPVAGGRDTAATGATQN